MILNLRVRSLDRVSELKERVAARTQLDPHTISLEYNGKELHKSLKLDHCGINEDGLSLTLSIIEPVPDRVSMEEIPWHAPCAGMGGSTQLPKDQYSQNTLNGNVGVVAPQRGASFASSQDSTEPNFIDTRTHYHIPYENTFRPLSNNIVRTQRYGQN